jgi:adenosylhomocysteine nucleosidase
MGLEAYPFLKRVEVTGLRRIGKAVYREAFFEGTTLSIVRCGIGPQRAAGAMRNLEVSPSAIICVGTAGALVEDLKLGDMAVSAETVLARAPDSIIQCSETLVDALVRACYSEGMTPKVVRLATVYEAVLRRGDRERLHRLTGAHAVDMESHAVGLEALRLGVPFACLRVISDDLSLRAISDRPASESFWKRPREIPRRLAARLWWWAFLRDLRRVVELLHPVLVELIRDQTRDSRSP